MIRQVGVVIPAANEQHHLAGALRALRASRDHLIRTARGDVRVRVVVVLDSCTDGTAAVAAGFHEVETLEVTVACVGSARHTGAMHVLCGGTPAGETWIANTDADSQVSPQWLAAMVDEADRGAHLLLGTVRPGPGLSGPVAKDWHDRHVRTDSHPHVHGANFGIRGDAYLALGGWPLRASGEDVMLANRAASAGHLRVIRTARIPVVTSARLHGRAPQGFSSYLRGLTA